jgi:hypothetical protein
MAIKFSKFSKPTKQLELDLIRALCYCRELLAKHPKLIFIKELLLWICSKGKGQEETVSTTRM